MSNRNIFFIIGAVIVLLLMRVASVQAQTPYDTTDERCIVLSPEEVDAEYEHDIASLIQLTEGNKRHAKPNLMSLLHLVEREWPRLLLRYAQPAVRGLLADRQTGSNTLLLKTTLFHDKTKGLYLAGGFARNTWGEREARLNFAMRF